MTAIADSALDTLKMFERYQGPADPGFIVDFLGTRTRVSYCPAFAPLDGRVEDYPVPGNFHATTLEWAGALAPVLGAEKEFTAVEIGAGWGPWLVATALAARRRNVNTIRLVGVEGMKRHCEFMRTHFIDNGLNPDDHRLLHGVVGTTDGFAEFPAEYEAGNYGGMPVLDSRSDAATSSAVLWRSRLKRRLKRAVKSLLGRPTPGAASGPKTERVRCWSLRTLLAPYPVVDLVHIDIQGSEHTVVAGSRSLLKQKAKWLVIGTHGREIEQQLFATLAPSWILEGDEACKYRQIGKQTVLHMDGCQIWRNPDLTSAAHAAA